MKAERARLARLQRLERIRDVARRTALAEAGRAEGTLAQLLALAERTDRLAAEYATRADAADAASLQQVHHFVRGLERISNTTAHDIDRARVHADARAAEAAAAERRRAAAEERAEAQARDIDRKIAANALPLGARKNWHGS
ncbi:MAG: hypothetical protein RIS94_890 [Pseudomonadota bacterium]|jgi:hypothetical protein